MSTTSHFLLHSPSLFSKPPKPPIPFLTTPKLSLRPKTKHLSCTFSTPSTPHSKTLSLPFLPQIPLPPLTSLTPTTIIKSTLIFSLSFTLLKSLFAAALNPFFWLYFSFTWNTYPYIFTILLTIYALHAFHKHTLNQATIPEQLSILTTSIAWLTLIPPAFFNGFLEGWPLALFFIYHYFFFFESSVRRRLYGDLFPRPHHPKWDIHLPLSSKAVFAALVFVGHWLAAYESPELQLISGGWANVATWVLVGTTLFMRYHAVLYLAKYSENVAEPMEVVQFGPYRWVRHPIYASAMLLFATHCVALRAPLSLGFLVAVCAWYYGRKAEVEEGLMVEKFGERYQEYAEKVRYKLIPFVY